MMNETSLPIGFRRWLRAAPHATAVAYEYAALEFSLAFRKIGFSPVEIGFDGIRPSANGLNFERIQNDRFGDFANVIFDNHFWLRFQVLFGRKLLQPPHEWVRAGSLVWRPGSDLAKFKLWGPRWWQLSRLKAFRECVDAAVGSVWQIAPFLNAGEEHAGVRASIASRRRAAPVPAHRA